MSGRAVQREVNPKDRRVHQLTLTKEGRKNYNHLGEMALAFNRQLKSQLGDEKFKLALSMLEEIRDLK